MLICTGEHLRPCVCYNYRIAGNFRGSKYSRGSAIFRQFHVFIYSCLLLALQVKVGKVASFVGTIFVLQCSTIYTKPTNIFPHENYPLYDTSVYMYIIVIMRLKIPLSCFEAGKSE